MSQSIMERLLGDESFFQDEYLLWPRRCGAERFLRRRQEMMDSFRPDVGDRLINRLFQNLDELFSLPESSSSSSSSTTTTSAAAASSSASSSSGPSLFSLDARGFSPEDVSVTVCGRKLEVRVVKPDGADLSRSVDLPENIDPSTLTCTLGDNGFLNVQAEVREVESDERAVPVRFRTSLDFPLSKDQKKD